MSTKSLSKSSDSFPSVFDDFFKPWNEWFNGGLFGQTLNVPAVNITENKDDYKVSVAAPGLKKDDFKINLEGNMLTITSEKEENKEGIRGKGREGEGRIVEIYIYISLTIQDTQAHSITDIIMLKK